jgi:hypothetical protein
MDAGKVRALVKEILALPDAERQELAREVPPTLMSTRAGLEAGALIELLCRRGDAP